VLALGSSALLVALWLLDVSGTVALTDRPLPGRLCQAAAGLAAIAWVAWIAHWVRGRARSARSGGSWWPWALPVAIVVSLAVHLVGIEWEAGTGFYRDEGIYGAAAEAINDGDLFPVSFIYGHLPYYALAFAAWLYERFPDLSGHLYGALFDRHTPHDHLWLTWRAVCALFGAATVVPVFLAAERVAGRLAAALAAALVVFSPLYNEITHLVISDVPSAFFAALALPFVARLLTVDRPPLGDWVWAGVAAGLAAASKYPAGVVAVAIVAVWARQLAVTRRFSWSLLWAGLAAIGTFFAAMPAFLVHGDQAFAGEGKDLLFGFRQYGRGGWIGVVRESDALFYAERLWQSFGPPALVLGLLGLLAVPRALRSRVAWLLPFPVLYMLLLDSMSMSVRRNLLPVLPWLALLLGVGVASLALRLAGLERVAAQPAAARRGVVGVLLAAALFVPVRATVEQDLRYTRASTGEAAVAWIREHVPSGARIVKESYTPRLDALPYSVFQSRFAARRPLEELRDPANDYLMLSWNAYGRFLREERLTQEHHRVYARRYREMLGWRKVREFAPGRTRLGPYLSLFRLEPETVDLRSERIFSAAEVSYVSPPASALATPTGALEIASPGFLLFKGHFAPGRYALRVAGAEVAPAGRVEVRTRDNEAIADAELRGGSAVVELREPEKYFFYLRLAPGSLLERFEVAPEAAAAGGQ
jgi:4-amino-4-deoxy-L-arabinose transferase-like glycosyltransferase